MNPLHVVGLTALLISSAVGLAMTEEAALDPWAPVVPSTVYTPPTAEAPPATRANGTIAPYEGPGCAEWADTALRGGFTPGDLPIALQVMELESMCLPGEIGDNGESFGLMQINSYWCQPSRYWPEGYLQTFGILADCSELLLPLVNLHAAWHIAAHHGWENWSTYDRVANG